MVDWKNIVVPISVAIITLIGGSLAFVIPALFKPNILIGLTLSNDDVHKVRIIVENRGLASAKDLRLTIVSPHNITSMDIFGTENYTKRYTNASSFQVIAPRFVQGKGSLISIVVLTDDHSNITKDDHYTVYTTYDQGSDLNIQYVLPRPISVPSLPQSFIDYILSASSLIAAAISIIAGTLAGLIIFLRRRKSRFLLGDYEDRDYAIIAQNVFHQLCELDEQNRISNKDLNGMTSTHLRMKSRHMTIGPT